MDADAVRGAPARHRPASTLTSGLQPPEPRGVGFCCVSHTVRGTLLRRPQLTKTVPLKELTRTSVAVGARHHRSCWTNGSEPLGWSRRLPRSKPEPGRKAPVRDTARPASHPRSDPHEQFSRAQVPSSPRVTQDAVGDSRGSARGRKPRCPSSVRKKRASPRQQVQPGRGRLLQELRSEAGNGPQGWRRGRGGEIAPGRNRTCKKAEGERIGSASRARVGVGSLHPRDLPATPAPPHARAPARRALRLPLG